MISRDTIGKVRSLLAQVDTWVEPTSYEASRFAYGCARDLLPTMDLPLGHAPTHIDLLASIARRMDRPQRYLELGVSFGKTLYCLANLFPGNEVYGVDWEAINPPLKRLLGGDGASIVGPRSEFDFQGKPVVYLEMDAMDPVSWELLQGKQFDLIFSDAFHSGDAIWKQYEIMRRYDVIKRDEFFILWDDIDYTNNPDMVKAFDSIASDLVQTFGLDPSNAFMFEINGWVGEHEQPHNMGVVNNMGITREVLLSDCTEGDVEIPLHPISRIDFNPLGQRLAFLQPSGIDPDGWLHKDVKLRLPKGVSVKNVVLNLEFYGENSGSSVAFEVFVDGLSAQRRRAAGPLCQLQLGPFTGDHDVSIELRFERLWVISSGDPRERSGRLASIDLVGGPR